MKKIFTLISVALATMSVNAQTESYVAITADGLASEFAAVVDENGVATNAADGKSIVTINTANVELVAVGGTTAASNSETNTGDCVDSEGNVTQWNDIKWDKKNQGDIDFWYVAGTGNPYVKYHAEEIVQEGYATGYYRVYYDTYQLDGSAGMPISGLYYKFTPKVAGQFKIGIWANKGWRKTLLVEESTMVPMPYSAEGYINGQNETYLDAEGVESSRKRYLSAEQVDSIHNKMMMDEINKLDTTITDETEKATKIQDVRDKYAWVIGNPNQASWLYVTFQAEAGKSYWLFQHTSQVGFQGFEFTPGSSEGISEITANADEKAAMYNLAGQKIESGYKGIVIRNGKKFILK